MAGSSFKWDDKKFRTEVNQKVKANMEKACLLVETDAKRICPVDTGRLRASLVHEIETGKDEITGKVGTNVEYASNVEFGTSKQSAQPYLRPSLKKNIPKIKQLFGGR